MTVHLHSTSQEINLQVPEDSPTAVNTFQTVKMHIDWVDNESLMTELLNHTEGKGYSGSMANLLNRTHAF